MWLFCFQALKDTIFTTLGIMQFILISLSKLDLKSGEPFSLSLPATEKIKTLPFCMQGFLT